LGVKFELRIDVTQAKENLPKTPISRETLLRVRNMRGVVIFVVFIIQKAQTFLLSFRVKRGIPGILLCLIIAWFQGFFTPLRCVQNDTYSIGFCKTP